MLLERGARPGGAHWHENSLFLPRSMTREPQKQDSENNVHVTGMAIAAVAPLAQTASHRRADWSGTPPFVSPRWSKGLLGLAALFLFLAGVAGLQAEALDWRAIRDALAQIETGGNPDVVGRAGERGAWQIHPNVSRQTDWATARRILDDRIDWFRRRSGKEPNAFDIYALWNAPGKYSQNHFRPEGLSKVVQDRCDRFQNLYGAMKKSSTRDGKAEARLEASSRG